ncbi:hypothetical protein L9G74_19495 [Shewanella sp. C32]|uniref:Uncharacterized protein n=1 Tax=Shewanella electrica TaxID=515560 RepID=A0ABT2FQJ3_9GAMM|nr:hypothetical protein [Shewanella electrica]MCH1927018.1 hypothetical protein [Shewanella electrica]MCS4558627.1 hypothetical protein [Shewanella electrica]
MEENIRYSLMAKGQRRPLGFFINGLFYEQLKSNSNAKGYVDASGFFYPSINKADPRSRIPTAKIDGLTYTRLSDIAEFELVKFEA